ncbi:MAG: hypothetical protein ACTHJR_08470 [Sphingomonas sp.]|uniref:hypothetical protein n=1 Tax=Sphingomonas sp. TaxID=28214 RepID=UPI003F7EEE07
MAEAGSISSRRDFHIGRVLSRAGDMVGRRLGAIAIIALLLAALPVPIRLAGGDALLHALRGGGGGQFLTYLLSLLVSAVFGALCSGALIWLAIENEDDRRIDAADALYQALRASPRLIGLNLMMEVAVAAATVLLVVPGVIQMVALTVAMPAAMIEGRAGTRAFDRSFDLTKGARWQIFVLWLIFWIATATIGAVIRGALGTPAMTMAAPPIGFILVQGGVAALSAIAIAALESSVYVELRAWKEGAPRDELRDIFA